MARYRIMPGHGPISLRQSPDPKNPLYEQWFNWRDGETFVPPPHLKSIGGLTLAECVAQGVIKEVKRG